MARADLNIGTWNLAGRWTDRHRDLLADLDCDVLLLTEVDEDAHLDGYRRHLTSECMAAGRRWAAILARGQLRPLPDPHPASAAAAVDGLTYCCSVLPWRSCGQGHPWVGQTNAQKTEAVTSQLLEALPRKGLVWGGDWNHSLTGGEYAGSRGGRAAVEGLLVQLGLTTPTADLPSRVPGVASIDHVAVGDDLDLVSAERVDAGELSDHDAYAVRAARRPTSGTASPDSGG